MQHCKQVADILLHCSLLDHTGCCIRPVARRIEGIRHIPVLPDHLGSSFDSGIPIDHSLHIAGSSGQAGKIVLLAGMRLRLGGNWVLLLLALALVVSAEGYYSGSSAVSGERDPPGRQDHPPMS